MTSTADPIAYTLRSNPHAPLDPSREADSTKLAVRFTETAAKLVVIGEPINAWTVLRQAWDESHAATAVLKHDGGKEALERLHADGYLSADGLDVATAEHACDLAGKAAWRARQDLHASAAVLNHRRIRATFPTVTRVITEPRDYGDCHRLSCLLDADGTIVASTNPESEDVEDLEADYPALTERLESDIADLIGDELPSTGSGDGSCYLDLGEHFLPEHTAPQAPLVQVLHVRHPDEGCGAEVWLDGRKVGAEVETVDPGRGYQRADWTERTLDATERAVSEGSAFWGAVERALVDNANSPFIDGDSDDPDW